MSKWSGALCHKQPTAWGAPLRRSTVDFFFLLTAPLLLLPPALQPFEFLMPVLQKPPKGKGLKVALEYVRARPLVARPLMPSPRTPPPRVQ